MCGCEAHHTLSKVCTCWCSYKDHESPTGALHDQQVRWDDAQKPMAMRILPTPLFIPETRPEI